VIRTPDPFEPAEELVRRVYAFVAYRIGDGPRAEDVTSETFVRALRYRGTYDPRRGSALAWLLGIARRAIADAFAESDRHASAGDELEAMADPFDLEEETVRRVELRRAVERLPARDRELIALRFGADLTARQIAGVLGMRTNAVEVALHRALARLRVELESPIRPSEAVRVRVDPQVEGAR
jgi:RNA polymerase sigma factor (sigma-70 family)